MRLVRLTTASLLAIALGATSAATQPTVRVDGNNITMQGCVASPAGPLHMPFETLMWSRGAMLTAGSAVAANKAADATAKQMASRVLYWIDDDELKEHAGRLVEVRG